MESLQTVFNALISRYVLEVYDDHFVLPNLGPIGSNGLANPRFDPEPLQLLLNQSEILLGIS